MKSFFLFRSAALAAMLLLGLALPSRLQAQCPSVMGTGDPAVILLNLYGMPYGQYFTPENEELQIGVSPGVQIGAIFSEQFQLVSGAEFSWIRRQVSQPDSVGTGLHYRTRIIEIPLDMRMRIGHNRGSEAFFTLGAGLVLSNMRETNDPTESLDETYFHQLYARMGFENTINVKKVFNILWGIQAKADPIALATDNYSRINGTYYLGLKVGIQLGL